MGAPLAIVVFGVRIAFGDDFEGMEDLELRRHAWIKRARDAGLEHWWSRVDDGGPEAHAFYIGDIVAKVGPENLPLESLAPDELVARCRQVGLRLVKAGLVDDFGPPALWTQWVPDF